MIISRRFINTSKLIRLNWSIKFCTDCTGIGKSKIFSSIQKWKNKTWNTIQLTTYQVNMKKNNNKDTFPNHMWWGNFFRKNLPMFNRKSTVKNSFITVGDKRRVRLRSSNSTLYRPPSSKAAVEILQQSDNWYGFLKKK